MEEPEAALERPSRARRLLAGAVLLGPVVLSFFSGGFFDKPRLVAGVLVWVVLAIVALLTGLRLPRETPGRLILAGLALLTVLTLASIAWAPLAGRALDDGQRLLLYLGFLLLALTVLRPRALARWAEPAVAAGTVVVVGYGLATRMVPWAVEPGAGYRATGRLDQPLTYWNALGAVAALGLVLCARLAADPERPRWMRIGAGAVTGALGAGLFLTYSRGSILFALVGLLALAVFVPRRSTLVACALVAVAAALGALSVAFLPAVADPLDGTSSVQGAAALALIAVIGAAAGFLAGRPAREAEEPDRRIARGALAVAGVALVAILALLLAGVSGVGSERVQVPTGPRAERLSSVESQRYDYWTVAGESFASHPVAGLGSGGFSPEWLRERPPKTILVRDAHSLYIETAAELGLAGLACLALLLAGVVLAARRGLVRDRVLAAGPAAALAGWAVHAGLDWDWEMPAVTMPALLLVAVLVVASEERAPQRSLSTR